MAEINRKNNFFTKLHKVLDRFTPDNEQEENIVRNVPAPDPNRNTAVFLIKVGGNGNMAGTLAEYYQLGAHLRTAANGRAVLTSPTFVSLDPDAGSKGVGMAGRFATAYNTFAEGDLTGALTGKLHVINALVSQSMTESTEDTSIADMVKQDGAADQLISAVLTDAEVKRPRGEGGYGEPKIIRIWNSTMLRIDTMVNLTDSIVQAYLDGKKILVIAMGSCIGASGATLINTVARNVHDQCEKADPNRIDNLRIHQIVQLGYAAHPAGTDEDEALKLDSAEDPIRISNWWKNHQTEGIDRYVDRVYLVDSDKVVACDRYVRGGDQGRHFTLGDLYALAAFEDGVKTAFDGSRDGYLLFNPEPKDPKNENRLAWIDFDNKVFAGDMVSLTRFAAFVLLKLKPMITGKGDDDLQNIPHIEKMLGEDCTNSAMVEEEILKPTRALIAMSEQILTAMAEIGATGSDYTADPVVLANVDTILFDPALLHKILKGDFKSGAEINRFALDGLTAWDVPNGGRRNTYTTNKYVGEVYERAARKLQLNDTMAQFALHIYRELNV